MKKYLSKILLKLILLLVPISINAEIIVIYAGELLAVPGETPLITQTIVIENKTIKKITSGYLDKELFSDNAIVIDLKNNFILPGLIDMHVHLQEQISSSSDSDTLKMSDQLKGMRSTHYAKKTLMAGFTTVRDLGSDEQYMYALRDAINHGWVDGPRVIAAGVVAITGGHGDVSGVKPDLMEIYTKHSICDGPYDCRHAARNTIKYGADLIKIASTGGVLTDRSTGTNRQMEMDEIREIVRAAKSMGKKVASHAHHEDGIIAALEAGADSIEHGTYADKKAISLFKKTGAYMVPTLLAGETVRNIAETKDIFSQAIKEKAIRVSTDMKGVFANAYKSGVKIVFGTDSGVSVHGDNAKEAILMVNAGMPIMEVIKSATINAADLLDMSEQIGTIEVGKQADIIATAFSPLEDITQLLSIEFVMKDGKVFKQ
jgi:imidazolonepropionase-like amidohydrolase